jgi:hypothetical protein
MEVGHTFAPEIRLSRDVSEGHINGKIEDLVTPQACAKPASSARN